MSFFVTSLLDGAVSGHLWRMLTAPAGPLAPAQRPLHDGQVLRVADTLTLPADATADEREMLERIAWTPHPFDVECRIDPEGTDGGAGDLTLRFPAPLPLGNPAWDTALLDWHIARGTDGQPTPGPAMLVLDILRGGNRVSSFVAKGAGQRRRAWVRAAPAAEWPPRRCRCRCTAQLDAISAKPAPERRRRPPGP
jgi:hypothetical protein